MFACLLAANTPRGSGENIVEPYVLLCVMARLWHDCPLALGVGGDVDGQDWNL